jgi:hypothetical protein
VHRLIASALLAPVNQYGEDPDVALEGWDKISLDDSPTYDLVDTVLFAARILHVL